MSFLWNDFTAFNGTLTCEILQTSSTDLKADIAKFHEWLKGVRNKPELHGIPAKHKDNVKKVFQALSGTDELQAPDHLPALLPIFETLDGQGNRNLKPLVVSFGSQDAQLLITDGASALGYLFSITSPPPHISVLWSEYLMPLLTLFSKCLFLAFVIDHTDKAYALSGVPVMANVMYLSNEVALENSSRPFFFGATISSAPYHKPTEVQFKHGRGLVTTWRRDHLLLPALRSHQQTLPPLDPTLHTVLVSRLDALIRGHPNVSMSDPRYALDANIFSKSWPVRQKVLNRVSLGGTPAVVPPHRLLRDNGTKATLQELLKKMVAHVYVESFDRQDPIIHADYQKLLRFYVAPHIFPPSTPQLPTPPEVVLVQEEVLIVDGILASLWSSHSNAALDKLTYLRYMQEKHEQPEHTTAFGRCAETYPVVAIQPPYFPSMKDQMGSIRGLAMEPRGIGVTSLFNTQDFSSATLKEVPTLLVLRTANESGSEQQVERFGIPANLPLPTDYDKDIDEADVGSW
ncbi:uncharacterized protein K460DRAFT_359472 [Cucurbitaria berberidis CBS 394.84]|uniref:Uncharacterized protein n=1 Tax=Cucurbitaria berberidis CBS 394.84 TaxID=1168544 RepID=A0A9P4G8H4_9PLEO|nr:uncharacterized protein K460DRAFT_359472 [Cucurbitaria berberidis CBS 394.84]KAF1840929.1 hypothetical protein K460DRAFT_359472 [Cucurbitaria berberidis CBS 394.84]